MCLSFPAEPIDDSVFLQWNYKISVEYVSSTENRNMWNSEVHWPKALISDNIMFLKSLWMIHGVMPFISSSLVEWESSLSFCGLFLWNWPLTWTFGLTGGCWGGSLLLGQSQLTLAKSQGTVTRTMIHPHIHIYRSFRVSSSPQFIVVQL